MTQENWQERTSLLLSEDGLKKLKNTHVLVVGLGGVGGYTVEALVRAGVGKLTLVDGDCFAVSNLNRQIFATQKTIGKPKALVAKQRAEEINPNVSVNAIVQYLSAQNFNEFDFDHYDCIVDAVDDVWAKVELACIAQSKNKKIVSCMGTGNKLLPYFKVGDLYKTTNCPLARVMRKKLKERGVKKLTVVYSEELPLKTTQSKTVGSISYAPGVAGLTVAYKVIEQLLE